MCIDDACQCATITVRRSKTDQFPTGKTVFVAATGGAVCPVTLLIRYFNYARLCKPEHFIFRNISPNGNSLNFKNVPLTYSNALDVFRKRLSAVGVNPSAYGLHSLRRGGATAAVRAGLSNRVVQRQGRWKCEDTRERYLPTDKQKQMSVLMAICK